MSKPFGNINRLMRSSDEETRRIRAYRRRLEKRQDELIKKAVEDMEEGTDEYEEVHNGAVKAFREQLSEEEQLRFDSRYLNDEREYTAVHFVQIGSVKKRNGRTVYLYGTKVTNAVRVPKGEKRNEKNEDGIKNKYLTE